MDNIQCMLTQLLTNQNNDDTTGSNHVEEENNNKPPKTEKSKESSSIDAKVINGIQAQIASLERWTEESKDDSSLPAGMGFSVVATEIQATNIVHVWWQEITQPAHPLLPVSNQ